MAKLSDDEWYAEVVRLCKFRHFDEWFYVDREAWLEMYHEDNMTPQEAVDLNYDYAI